MSLSQREQIIIEGIENNREIYIETSQYIHNNPEIGCQEYKASAKLIEILKDAGFEIETNVDGYETGFIATKGSGSPTIGFLAEYDALAGLGHACGHNIIGTASVAAAINLANELQADEGTIQVFGTPSEEGGPNGSAKAGYVNAGVFDNADACLMIHPSSRNGLTSNTLAVDPLDFEYIGKPAHASSNPFDGVNALDAIIQLFNGIGLLRQQLKPDVRIHGIITHGGDAPNIIPEYTKARFYIRATTRAELNIVTNKVKDIARGAALATGTEVNIIPIQNGVDNFVLTNSFDQLYKQKAKQLGIEIKQERRTNLGSTDAGNVSHVVPTIHPTIAIGPEDLIGHTVQFEQAACSAKGDEAVILGAKALAITALELITDTNKLQQIREEWLEQEK